MRGKSLSLVIYRNTLPSTIHPKNIEKVKLSFFQAFHRSFGLRSEFRWLSNSSKISNYVVITGLVTMKALFILYTFVDESIHAWKAV